MHDLRVSKQSLLTSLSSQVGDTKSGWLILDGKATLGHVSSYFLFPDMLLAR